MTRPNPGEAADECERCAGKILTVIEVDGGERRCVACGRAPTTPRLGQSAKAGVRLVLLLWLVGVAVGYQALYIRTMPRATPEWQVIAAYPVLILLLLLSAVLMAESLVRFRQPHQDAKGRHGNADANARPVQTVSRSERATGFMKR